MTTEVKVKVMALAAEEEDEDDELRQERLLEEHNQLYGCESFLFSLLCIVDISLNSTIEYGELQGEGETVASNTIITM